MGAQWGAPWTWESSATWTSVWGKYVADAFLLIFLSLSSFHLRMPGWDVMALNMVKSDRELHCNGTTFKSKINGRWTLQPQWARFELNSKCSISTPDLSVGTRFSCYKGCRAVGTKINKILNCYLALGGWDGTLLTFKFFIWLDLENVHVEEDSGKSEQHSFLCRVRQESDTGAQLWSSK